MAAGNVPVPDHGSHIAAARTGLIRFADVWTTSLRMRNRIVPQWFRCAATLPRSLDRVRLLVLRLAKCESHLTR